MELRDPVSLEAADADSGGDEEVSFPSNNSLQEQLAETNSKVQYVTDLLLAHMQQGSCGTSGQSSTSVPLSSVPPMSVPSTSAPSTSQAPTFPPINTSSELLGAAMDNLINEQSGEFTIKRAPILRLGATLSENIKRSIQDKAFIDLTTLMSKKDRQMELAFDGTKPVVKMSSTNPNIKSIIVWLRLFGTYAAIYLEAKKNQHEGPALFAYMLNILNLHKTQPQNVWLRYDERFRQLKAVPEAYNTGPLVWEVVNLQILFEVAGSISSSNPGQGPSSYSNFPSRGPSSSSNMPSQGPFSSRNQPFRPQTTKVCFSYNGGGCNIPNCRFPHNCEICGKAGHPTKKCFTSTRPQQNSLSSNTSKPQ